MREFCKAHARAFQSDEDSSEGLSKITRAPGSLWCLCELHEGFKQETARSPKPSARTGARTDRDP